MTGGFGSLKDRAKMLTGTAGKVAREKAASGANGIQKPGGIEKKRVKNAFTDIASKATGGLLAQYKPELAHIQRERTRYIKNVKDIGVANRSIRRQKDHYVGSNAWKADVDKRCQLVSAVNKNEKWAKGRIAEFETKRAEWQKNVFEASRREEMTTGQLAIFDEEQRSIRAEQEVQRQRKEKWVYVSDRCFVDSHEARRINDEKDKIRPEHLSKCEADLPITTFLRRELQPKVADAVSRILLHDYTIVREVRADWCAVKARLIKHLLKGESIALKLQSVLLGLGPASWIADLFTVVRPKDFIDTTGTTATVQEIRMMQKYFNVASTCAQVRKYWKTLRPAAEKNFDQYRVAHMENSWLFHMDDAPPRWIREPKLVLRQKIEQQGPPSRRISVVEKEQRKDDQESTIQAMVVLRSKKRVEAERKRKGSAKNAKNEPWGRDAQTRA
jgi:hypothetical protein